VGIVDLSRRRNKLPQDVDGMRNVRTSDTKIDKTPNTMTILSGIVERHTISGAQVNTKLYRCISCANISENSTRKDILNVFSWEVDDMGSQIRPQY
jgi:hypothetical protein